MELEALGNKVNEINSFGATLVAISPQLTEYNRAMRDEKDLKFEILSDPGNKVAISYGIVHQLPDDLIKVYAKFGVNLPEYNGDDSWTLPMPARLIIDRESIIRYAEINPDYTIRPEPEDTLERLRSIVNTY